MSSAWNPIVQHYEQCLSRHGVSPAGVDWPNGADLAARFGVMFELLDETSECYSLLDIGCGTGFALDYLAATGDADRVQYHGIDLSQTMLDAARKRWPMHEFSCRDIVANPIPDRSVDVAIMNGVLTERVSLDVDAMTVLAESLVTAAFRVARLGIAFNVMNAHVDWQRDDLFHWPFDTLASFLRREVSPHFAFRADYGLNEYTCFVRREPRRRTHLESETWWRT
jgi:SAM-dependent methyltransferase